jgi:hypothetical protein
MNGNYLPPPAVTNLNGKIPPAVPPRYDPKKICVKM